MCLCLYLEGISDQLADGDKLGLEEVVLQVVVGGYRADAVLREAGGLYAQLPQQLKDGRENVAVALQLDDYQLTCACIAVGLMVMESDVEVNGQTLGLVIVDQCDALETVLHRGDDVVEGGSRESLDEWRAAGVNHVLPLLRRHGDTFLLRASVVILRLHFQESQLTIQVSADAYLLSGRTAVVMF